jgi:hypothetical protein
MTNESRVYLAAMTIALVAMVGRMGWINWTLVALLLATIAAILGLILVAAVVLLTPIAIFFAIVDAFRRLFDNAPVLTGTHQ